MLIHINYVEALGVGGTPTVGNWNVTGLTSGGTPDSIDVLANEIKLTYITDSVVGTVEVDQTSIDNEAKTAEGVQVGTYADIVATAL